MNSFPPPNTGPGTPAALMASTGVDVAGSSSISATGRETGGVSDLPPPPPPPPGASGSAPAGPAVAPRAATTGGGSGWDWDRAKEMAEAWFRPLTDPQGWWALGYLFFSTVASPFLFGAMVAVGSDRLRSVVRSSSGCCWSCRCS